MDERLLNRIYELNNDVIIKPAEPKDSKPFTDLVNLYVQRKKTEKYFEWLYIVCPFSPVLFVAYHKNKLIGFFGCQLRMLNNGLIVALCTELLIREDYRNRGLFFLLEKHLSDYAFSNKAVAVFALSTYSGLKSYKGLGTWDLIGTVKTLSLQKEVTNFDSRNLTKPEESLNCLVCFIKEAEYDHWRFDMHFVNKYSHLISDLNSNIYCKTFYDDTNNTKYGDIIHFTTTHNNQSEIEEMFDYSIKYFTKKSITNITTWALPHTITGRVAQNIGFNETNLERYFCGRVIDKKYDYLLDFKKWHLVQADSEIY